MSVVVGVIEDDTHVIEHVIRLIKQSANLRLGGVASSRAQAVALIGTGACDVYLLDIGLPDVDGLDLVAEIQERSPDAKIMVVTSYSNAKQILRSVRLGVAGYILKYELGDDLERQVIDAYNGKNPVSAEVSSHLFKRIEELEAGAGQRVNVDAKAAELGLSTREWAVLQLLIKGLSIAQIGDHLSISPHTVNQHLRSIYSKLGVTSRSMAVSAAIGHGLVE
jgi:DNA-binding NarL/FixJ family response regulator